MRIIIFAMLVALVPFPVSAATSEERITLITLAGTSYYETERNLFGTSDGWEMNPMLGRSPSRSDLALYGGTGLVLALVLAEVLPEKLGKIVMDSAIQYGQQLADINSACRHRVNKTYGAVVPFMVSWRF